MQDVKLCFLPPRLGGRSMALPQCKRASHLALNSGWSTTLRRRLAKWVAQDTRADLGMRLMSPQSMGEKATELHAVPTAEDWLSVARSTTSCETDATWLDGLSGNLCEPGHGFLLGPCLCTVPSPLCNWKVEWHTLQMPLDLLASLDTGHQRVCDIAIQVYSTKPALRRPNETLQVSRTQIMWPRNWVTGEE